MQDFLTKWGESAFNSLGFFWMALWAFILGYAVSSLIQIFIAKRSMQKLMGGSGLKSISFGAFFGFISSSCSFSALATTKSLFQKGASFISSMAFLLASTNLVIELGIVISIFLGWKFVVGEYVGGLLLILLSWILIRIIKPMKLIESARNKLGEATEKESMDKSLSKRVKSHENWAKVGKQYAMEWKMVWKDVTVGFTLAGIISVFVPDSFFQTLFINSGVDVASFDFLTLLQHVVIGPVAAFCTFIGSMGNIPLAALLYTKGISFAGVMAFIFSDLVVFPVLRINARYYGWKMSLFILLLLFISLCITSLGLHYGFEFLNLLPGGSNVSITKMDQFSINYTFWLNIPFLVISGILIYFGFIKGKKIMHHMEMAPKSPFLEKTLKVLAFVCYGWLLAGVIIELIIL